jgi:hypothetical protein
MIMSVNDVADSGKRRYRRFVLRDLQDVATLAAKRMTDVQACQHLGINYFSFKSWVSKHRHEAKFAEILSHARADLLAFHIKNIEDAAVGAGVHVKADWRASKAIVDHSFPELAPQVGAVDRQPIVNVLLMASAAKKIYDVEAKLIQDKPKIKLPVRCLDPSKRQKSL